MKTKIFTVVLFTIVSLGAFASNGEKDKPLENNNPRVVKLVERVNEIQAMDLKELDRKEKRALKVELRGIEKELKKEGLDSKVSISVGAIIIILLLLILI